MLILTPTLQTLAGQSGESTTWGVMTMLTLTDHPHQQGVTYFEHWNFAMGIAWRLLTSVFAFALHAALPFISIEPRLDLEATAAYLNERNHFIEAAAATAGSKTITAREASKPDRKYTPALA